MADGRDLPPEVTMKLVARFLLAALTLAGPAYAQPATDHLKCFK
jgi:hypothetical protein